MDIKSIRSDFTVFVVDDEESILSIVEEALEKAGYQCEIFPTGEAAFERLQKSPPHVVLSDIRMPGISGIELLEKIRAISQDIQFIIMTSHASLDTAITAMRLGAYDYLHKPFENLEDVVKTVDRTIEKLFLQYENEQLLAELETKNTALSQLNARISQEKEEVLLINNLMAKFSKARGINEVVQTFVDQTSLMLGSVPTVFLTYYPSYFSYVVTNCTLMDKEKIKNVGLNLKDQPKEVNEGLIKDPQNAPLLKQMVQKFFNVDNFLSIPIADEVGARGIFLILKELTDVSQRRLLDSFIQIFLVSHANAIMQKNIHDMAIKDALTGLFNRRFFNQKLEEEISRSRRTRMPVSLIYFDVDHFKKYNDQNGHPMGDVLLKMISKILQQSARTNDIVARVGGEEFVYILPHTDKMGAAIKAEKLRRTIEATNFPHGEKQPLGRVSISLGVSEYPSLASDPESLVKSADEALYHVKATTRNKVCLATAPPGFKPDFDPIKVEPGKKEGA